VCERAGWQVHAYCLMGNHFHLVVETPQPTLVAGMKCFLGTYTQRFNERHRMRGHLFAGEGELAGYVWKSYPEYLKDPAQRVEWLRVDRLLGEMGIQRDNAAGWQEFREYMEERRRAEGHADEELWSAIRRGWRFGTEDFLERLVEKASRDIHKEEAVAETMEEKARGLMREFLEKRNTDVGKLRALRKRDPLKIEWARELRKCSTMTMGWIAQELSAGTPKSLWNALGKARAERSLNARED
jgi:putative transposase